MCYSAISMQLVVTILEIDAAQSATRTESVAVSMWSKFLCEIVCFVERGNHLSLFNKIPPV